MIIAINARTLRAVPHDGIGWFTLEVVRGIVSAHPGHRFVLIGDRRYEALPVEGANVEYVTIPLRTVHPVLWYKWHEIFLPGVLKRTGAGLFIAPDGIMPLRTEVPCIPVIHDLNHEHRPGDIPWSERVYYSHFFPRFARQAARVATVSGFSADDISETYGISRDKIDVVPNGVAGIFSPPLPGEAEATRSEYTGGRPYFLFVSNFSPRKECGGGYQCVQSFQESRQGRACVAACGQEVISYP